MTLTQKLNSFFCNLYPIQVLTLKFGKAPDGIPLRKLPYIFIIGFNKAGTRSLTHLFRESGIPSVHWDENRLVRRMLRNDRKGRRLLSGYDSRYLVYSDLILADATRVVEGNKFFSKLFDQYPGSLFILNTRPTERWVDSRVRHRNGEFLARHMKIVGTEKPADVMALWGVQKEKHEARVREFFSDKPGRFVEVDIEFDNVPELLSTIVPYKLESLNWKHVGKSPHNTKTSLERASDVFKESD